MLPSLLCDLCVQVLWLYWGSLAVSYLYNFTKVAPANWGAPMRDPAYLQQWGVSIINAQFNHVGTQKIR